MSYYGYGFKPYVSVATRRKQAEKIAAKGKKSGANFSPIEASRGAIAKTFWGKAWCDNLEAYSDYDNRLPRGRTYVRNGSVLDLQIGAGEVQAQVLGSSLYKVTVRVTPVAAKQWQAIGTDCAGSIDSLVELLQGKLSTAVMQRICKRETGLFPAPKELKFSCSCPDWADMCKHVAAVLYGVGARLDQKPELLFSLRGVDAKALVSQAGAGLPKSKKNLADGKVLDNAILADVFGIEIDEAVVVPKRVIAKKPSARVKTPVKAVPKVNAATSLSARIARHPEAKRKLETVKKPRVPTTPAKDVAPPRTKSVLATARKLTPGKPPVTKGKAVAKMAVRKKS